MASRARFAIRSLAVLSILVVRAEIARAQSAPVQPAQSSSEQAPAASPPPSPEPSSGVQWSLDARAGLPVLKEGDTRLAADLSAGLRGKTFGLDVRGSAGTFDIAGKNGAFSQTDRAEGSLEGFVRFGSEAFAPELRVAGGAAYYGTTIHVPGSAFTDDDSILGRGSLLLGFRGVTPAIGYGLLVGGGLQVESRDTLAAPTTANATIAIDDSETIRSRLEARLRLRAPFYGDKLALRLIEDASVFRLTRDASAIRVDTSPGTAGATLTNASLEVQQIESRTRLALDIQALAFGPFMPTLFAGLDVVAQRTDAGNVTAVVPLAGLGLVHPEGKN